MALTAQAGNLHPSIIQQFTEKPNLEYHSVIVILDDQAPIFEIDATLKGNQAAQAVIDSFQSILPDRKNRGVKEKAFYVLRKTAMPRF